MKGRSLAGVPQATLDAGTDVSDQSCGMLGTLLTLAEELGWGRTVQKKRSLKKGRAGGEMPERKGNSMT